MTLSSDSRCRSHQIGTAILFGAAFWAGAWAAEPSPTSIEPGAVVTFRDAAGRDWCAKVVSLDKGPGGGGETWAWLRMAADPRRTEKAPLAELTPGCGIAPGGRAASG